jgi:N-acetylmuramoyl-L-alanine amidase
MAKVFLSAGHGGSDPGAVGNGIKEKDANLYILLGCRDVLVKHGVTVVCSRTKDENDPVGQEVKEANASGADLAVSFHNNAGGGDGYEAYCILTNANAVKLVNIATKYINAMGQNNHGNPLKSGAKLYFVKNTKMTSVLFETFFVDSKDVEFGNTEEKQRSIGEAYAKAILEYFGIAEIKEEVKETIKVETENESSSESFLVRIKSDDLSIREGAGTEYKKVGAITDNGSYTIVETKKSKDGGTWGKLKSGAGWINISERYVAKA